METIELLRNYKKRLDPFLENYFKNKSKKAGSIDPIAKQAVDMIAEFTLAGGKRIRPALVYYGYLASGGKKDFEIIEASMAIELVHTFLLIHDDIIDRDEKRHGVETIHERYKKIGQKINYKKNTVHFGNSMAMIAGDIAASMANEILFNAKFKPETIIRGLDKLQDIVYMTIPGEMIDVVLEHRGGASEEEILKMHEGKTARYSFEGPLQLGGVLADADGGLLSDFSRYALPVGKAFQVVDDILGVFGDEKKLGKPVGSDIIEGKQTLLVIKSLEKGDSNQKQKLKKLLGKSGISSEEIEEFRRIIKETGALDYSKKLAVNLVSEALQSLEKINFKNREAKVFLEGIARYIIEREC